jgi:restriction endonuclease S subunit
MNFILYKEASFKKTPIGKIPKDWELAKLSDIAEDIYYGITAKAVENNTGLKMLRTTDIKDYTVDWDSLPFCEVTEKRGDIQRFLLKKEDLIIARAGTTGVSVLVEKDFENVVFGSYLIKVRLNRKVLPKFMRYFCQSHLYWDHITSSQAGSTLKNISLPVLKSLNIPLPSSIEEQQNIAEVLSVVDEAILKTNEIIGKTERLKKGLMQELLSKGLILGFMFDTDVFNAILNEHIDLERLPRNLKYYVTHTQYDEICSTQSEVRKRELLKIFEKVPNELVATEGAVYGVSRDGMAKFVSEADAKQYNEMLKRLKGLDEKIGKKKPFENQARDVLIVLTSIKNCLILVTKDKNLKMVTEEFNGQAITFEQFQKGEYKEFKGSEIGRIPKNWEVVKLGNVITYRKGIKPNVVFDRREPNTLPYLTADDVRAGIFTKWARESDKTIKVNKDDVILIWDGFYCGDAFIGLEGILSSTMIKIEPKSNLNGRFLFYILKTHFKELNTKISGMYLKHVNKSVFENLKLPLPPPQEQQKIAEILSIVDKKLEVERNEKAKLEKIKRGLMDLLLTGKVRVKVNYCASRIRL